MNEFIPVSTQITPYSYEGSVKLLADAKLYEYAIIYSITAVRLYKANTLTPEALADFNELRAFNKDSELRVNTFDGTVLGRIRTDGIGQNDEWYNTEVVDEAHLLWGDPKKNQSREDGYTFLSETRGTEITVPFDVPINKNAFVVVRNYVSINKETLEFDDWRMMDFIVLEATEYGEKE
ncbi:MAG: CRISPR-associated protein Csx19 [Oscillospiraceae bacterium]|nr:CRISPR-associated protein Csx19 [Oscillospiraceae bacterium]